jgi:hypothetical protein
MLDEKEVAVKTEFAPLNVTMNGLSENAVRLLTVTVIG